jgi:hypothetical protein
MVTKETPEELEARKFFEHLGYVVTKIPEVDNEKRADYRVEDAADLFIVEVKGRGPDLNFTRQLEEFAYAESQQPVDRMNRISKQISNAADQLAATDDGSALRLIAFVAAGDDPDLQVEQFQRTLYGTVDLLQEGDSEVTAVPCFYFTFNDFFRFRHVDGAVILSPRRGAKLCVNDFSDRRDRLRTSKLYQTLSASGAITDPMVLEKSGKAFVADTDDLNRRDETAVLDYVRKKYSRPELLTFRPTQYRAAAKIPYESRQEGSS